ncbi:hypothetical protein ElyMa_000110100 [Elysia marginata]|uniref:Uncharacterized protein n=1 Tax=Elysia marginata TaxID=1093978 RepID=A0AAV4EL65_9GAST|nr:hypothetical protein ElyMa_000110100 [Elysia marginata]
MFALDIDEYTSTSDPCLTGVIRYTTCHALERTWKAPMLSDRILQDPPDLSLTHVIIGDLAALTVSCSDRFHYHHAHRYHKRNRPLLAIFSDTDRSGRNSRGNYPSN